MAIGVTCFSDPACPWAYSANPAFAVLRWRYGAQLQWRLAVIGLAEDPGRYVRAGYSPARSARGYRNFQKRFGMPFATAPRARIPATALACRAVVAARRRFPEREWDVYRALQFAWFTTTLVPDEPEQIGEALARFLPELDAAAIVDGLDDPETEALYQADRDEARSAAGGPTELQGKTSTSDGPVRFTAPSLVFSSNGSRLEAGGWQPVEAYDVLVANLDPTLERRDAPEDPADALAAFPGGLVTEEVTAIMTPGNNAPDRAAAEDALIELVGEGRAERFALGQDALWRLAG